MNCEIQSDWAQIMVVNMFYLCSCYAINSGPIKHTIDDHWKMIWQHNTRKIVMLTNLKEAGKVSNYLFKLNNSRTAFGCRF